MAEMKPCPFCGGEAEIVVNVTAITIECKKCSAMIGRKNKTISFNRGQTSFDNIKEAVKAWNTRTPQKPNHNSLCETETYKVGGDK